jgi:hypothetical protein
MVVTMRTTADHGRLSLECPRARAIYSPWKVCRGQPWGFSPGSRCWRVGAAGGGAWFGRRSMRRAPPMGERIGRGSLAGRWKPRP